MNTSLFDPVVIDISRHAHDIDVIDREADAYERAERNVIDDPSEVREMYANMTIDEWLMSERGVQLILNGDSIAGANLICNAYKRLLENRVQKVLRDEST